jgi:hypothetical protein
LDDATEVDTANHYLFVLTMLMEKRKSKIKEYYIRGRKKNIFVIHLTQYYLCKTCEGSSLNICKNSNCVALLSLNENDKRVLAQFNYYDDLNMYDYEDNDINENDL